VRILITAALLLAPNLALAHPVDEVVQGAYLTMVPGQVQLELDIVAGTMVLGTVTKTLDPNGDRSISPVEARAFGMAVLGQSSLAVDGRPVAWRFDRVEAPTYDQIAAGDIIKVYATAARPDRPGGRTLAYDNRYRPATSRVTANVFLRPAGGWRYQVTGQERSADGGRLTVRYAASR
jgi:hypothetical protein